MLSRASGRLLRKLTRESPPRPKNIFMDCCVRAPCVLRRSQMCRLRFDLRTRRNREPATFTLGIFCVRKEISCDQKQLRSRTASTWISLHAYKDMFLQNDCCDLAPPDRLIHTKMLRFRHGGTLGSQSTRKKTWISIMINKQVHAIKMCCVLALRAHLDLTPRAMRHLHATRLLRSHAASTLDLSPCAKRHVPAKRLLRSRAAPNIDDF